MRSAAAAEFSVPPSLPYLERLMPADFQLLLRLGGLTLCLPQFSYNLQSATFISAIQDKLGLLFSVNLVKG
jgi:hypothetical protein